jgi:WD40 repeat protein
VWVIAHAWDSNEFYAYLVSAKGVQEPVVSAAGSIHGGGDEERNSIGYMKTSPDGSKLALAITGNNLIELCNFNNETGVVTTNSTYTLTRPNINPYGIEFSPDSKLLYATAFQTQNPPLSNPSILYQFNLQNGLANPFVVDSTPGMSVAAMQLATDGRIYLSRTVNIISKKDSVDLQPEPSRYRMQL